MDRSVDHRPGIGELARPLERLPRHPGVAGCDLSTASTARIASVLAGLTEEEHSALAELVVRVEAGDPIATEARLFDAWLTLFLDIADSYETREPM